MIETNIILILLIAILTIMIAYLAYSREKIVVNANLQNLRIIDLDDNKIITNKKRFFVRYITIKPLKQTLQTDSATKLYEITYKPSFFRKKRIIVNEGLLNTNIYVKNDKAVELVADENTLMLLPTQHDLKRILKAKLISEILSDLQSYKFLALIAILMLVVGIAVGFAAGQQITLQQLQQQLQQKTTTTTPTPHTNTTTTTTPTVITFPQQQTTTTIPRGG